ncbi:MAG: hypothetical protein HY308_07885 [Gammaproteobacteria bacterium]|nr:hypothetical protein [Gammaproteobacteria bacterium]
MKTEVGLWIDHTRAVIVTVTDEGESVKSVAANVDRQPRRYDGVVSTASREPRPADDHAQRTYRQHLSQYYDEVIAQIPDGESVVIFGPGEAKTELKKRLDKNHFPAHVVGVETVDKMTDRQIVEKVREHFPMRTP